jgi:hypothetical protein
MPLARLVVVRRCALLSSTQIALATVVASLPGRQVTNGVNGTTMIAPLLDAQSL